MKKFLILFTLVLLLPCVSLTADAEHKGGENFDKTIYLNQAWWAKYNDTNLTEYIDDAYRNNQDLKIAALNTKQAREVVKQSFANQLPQLGFYPDISRTFQSSNINHGKLIIPDYNQSNFFLPISMTYEADIWGQNFLRTKSLKKQAEIVAENERATYISLTSAIAADYFNLIKADKLILSQKELIKLQNRIIKMTAIKYENGLCPVTEYLSEKQYLTQLKESKEFYENTRKVLENQLIVLLGDRNRTELHRGYYAYISAPQIPQGISAEVIQNRPDLLKTEKYIQKIGIDVKVARRDFLPKFNLYGEVGFNAYSFGNIFGNHTFRALAGVLPSVDLFTGGAKMSALRYSKLEYDKAQQMYEKTILTSLQEVSDSLHWAKTTKKNYESSRERHKLEQTKFTLMMKKNSIGAMSDLDLLRAKEALIVSEISEASNRIDYLISTISLYKSVGGVDYMNFEEKL